MHNSESTLIVLIMLAAVIQLAFILTPLWSIIKQVIFNIGYDREHDPFFWDMWNRSYHDLPDKSVAVVFVIVIAINLAGIVLAFYPQ